MVFDGFHAVFGVFDRVVSLRQGLSDKLLAEKLHGDVAQAARTFVESASEGKRTCNLHIEMLSLGHLGDAQVLEGRLHDAYKTFQQTLAAPPEILQRTPFFSISKAGLGNLTYEWNELEKAEEYFRAAIEHGMWWRNWENLLPGYTGLARIHAIRGDWDAAFANLDELLKNTQEKEGIVQTRVESLRALLNLRKGNIESAVRWAEAYEPERPCDFIVEWEEDALVGCRVWIACGQAERAGGLLERIASEARTAGRNAQVLEALCLQSILFASIQRDSDAMSVLAMALEMAKPENYIRTFADEGEPMAELLALAAKKGIHPEYAGRLLEAFPVSGSGEMPGRDAKGRSSRSGDNRLIAPLSERELEVIALIAEGYSNKEIAQRLHVSVRTVKYYITGIFTKLEVDGRAHAAVKAKEIGLLK